MKSVTNKIILISSIFLIITIGITIVAYSQIERYQPQCATEIPQLICGTESLLSDNAKKGKNLFNAYCAACHKLYKKMTGPSLKGLVQNGNYPSKEYFFDYVRNEQKLNDEKDEYAKAINDEYSLDYVHQFKLTDIEVEQLLEYIAE